MVKKMRLWAGLQRNTVCRPPPSKQLTRSPTQTFFLSEKIKIPSGGLQQITYEIRKGDSLGSIASRFGVKQSTLIEVNKISRPDLIKIGQKLLIPLKGTSVKQTSLLPSITVSALNKIRSTPAKWKRIVIHHSATPTDDALNMHRVHKARGMKNGLAYHFVISNGSKSL